ncbi:Putative uncharacterized protein [Taphrina deformans PYCC 5710]|uniref:Inositol-1-monophosphatase n=1 Tax=Taphrina deformans (strain PYCC 5710 / ATCC 11124 / CBS 356.35 / IMI 108563 / JCM 9778 / NBRC 8474) TaxID=1097556 RepID=R4XC02_TAPDE|nr:Putative uncharacterized protein [Taphrina deformans PYCC 5710]|eukprot:CCG80870.1 Putative uncharacterized protein [Taphrina deformans PYCC 5710]
MSTIDLEALRDFAVDVARRAGTMITSARSDQKSSAAEKKNSVDLVTEVDQAVEAFIIQEIKQRYPEHKFIGEETYSASGQTASILNDEPTWIVDPIDGTTNFIHGFPFVAVSIGFAIKQVPTVGVVYGPFLDYMYTGIKGQGSFLNDQKLPLNSPAPKIGGLGNCVVAVEWGSDRTEDGNLKVKSDTYFNLTRQGGGMCHSLRSLGSAALNLCAVASGSMDCYVEGGMWEWDICAGWVILTEAGGLMTTANPAEEIKEPGLCDRMILAVRGSDTADQHQIVREYWAQTAGRLVYDRK